MIRFVIAAVLFAFAAAALLLSFAACGKAYNYDLSKYITLGQYKGVSVSASEIEESVQSQLDSLLKQKAEGVQRKLVHFECKERAIPRNGYELCDADGNTIGNVTSGIMLPTTKVGIGMGYVKTAFAAKGNTIYVKIREKLIPAEIV